MLFCLISRKHLSAITKGKHILILSKSYYCSVCVFLDVTPQGPSTDLQRHAAWLNRTTGILILIIKKYGIMLLSYLDALILSKVVLVLISEPLD